MCAERFLALAVALALTTACGSKPERQTEAPKPAATGKTAKAPAAAVTTAAPGSGAKAPPASDKAYAEALAQLKANQLQDAETGLAAVAKTYPNMTAPHTNLGIVYARTNRKPQAAAAFARAVAADPANAVAHNWLGVLAREAGDLNKAEAEYQAALAADPGLAQAQLNLAILYDQYLKRPADALAAYRRYEDLTGKKDLRVAVWIAELQAQQTAAAASTPAPATPPPAAAPRPAPSKTGTKS